MKKQIWLGVTLLAAVVMALPAMAKAPTTAEIAAAANAQMQAAASSQQSLVEQLCNAAKRGDVSRIRELLDTGRVNVEDTVGKNKWTPLICAVDSTQYQAAKVLLEEYHADPKAANKHGWTVLHYAVYPGMTELDKGGTLNILGQAGAINMDNVRAKIGRIVDLILSQPGVKEDAEYLNQKVEGTALTALYAALWTANKINYPELGQKLVDIPAIDVNMRSYHKWTPLSYAVNYGNEELVRILLTRDDIDVEKPLPNGTTPLALAKERGARGIVKMLKEKGATR